ncbi:MAG: hypothetical protein GX027_06790 [Clostridiaceae bacterium]|jgi:hypothetical protein|nr:hypothetical protein [Clostridiaceae bacterium]
MDSPVWKILGFFLAAVLLFLVPVMNMLERQESAAYTTVFTETNRFADSARDTGYITPNMYSEFIRRLNATGCTFDIRIEHAKSTISPVYRQNGQVLEFTGEYEISRVVQDHDAVLSVLFPDDPTLGAFDRARRYDMKAGDLLFVEVKNSGKTMITALRDMILLSDTRHPTLFVRAGGLVRNEAY